MRTLRHIPFLAFLLIFYNIVAFSGGSDRPPLDQIWLETGLVSGATLRIAVSDLIVMFGVVGLYIEIFKATRPTNLSILDHVLSMVVFVVFLIEFIVVPQVGRPSFLILTLMSFLDVIAGFTVSIVSARRDIRMS